MFCLENVFRQSLQTSVSSDSLVLLFSGSNDKGFAMADDFTFFRCLVRQRRGRLTTCEPNWQLELCLA